MDLTSYLTKHDGKPRSDGPECIRLAAAVGVSSYYLYLAALGHKKFGPDKVLRLHQSSIGGDLAPQDVRPDVDWHRDGEGRITAYAVPAREPKVA